MRFLAVIPLFVASAAAQMTQNCPPSLLDDFKTSQQQPLALLSTVGNAGSDHTLREPSAPGGFRRYLFTSADNRFAQTAELSIRPDETDGKSTLVVSAGLRQSVFLQIDYGVDDHGAVMPLHLRPQSGCDRIRLIFDSNSHQLNVFSQFNVPGVGLLSSEAIVPGTDHPFCVDFFLAKFLPAQPTPPDLSRTGIDGLHLLFNPEGAIGAHDYAIKQMEFAGANTNLGVGPCVAAP
jgi:hypothetical protein